MAACADNDVNTVRRLLGDGNNTINEGTDDGESLLSLACSAGYYELAQVCMHSCKHVNSAQKIVSNLNLNKTIQGSIGYVGTS